MIVKVSQSAYFFMYKKNYSPFEMDSNCIGFDAIIGIFLCQGVVVKLCA